MSSALPFRWLRRGGWAILDQGFFSVTSFAMNIALARWLGPTEYGAFAVAYSALLLVATVHTALLTEPMLVFGAGRYGACRASYLRGILLAHWPVAVIIGAALSIGGTLVFAQDAGAERLAFVALGIACPFILFQWLARKAVYVESSPHHAAKAGMAYFLGLAGALFALRVLDVFSLPAAIAVVAAASLLTGAWLHSKLNSNGSRAEPPMWDRMVRDHLRYGPWAVGTAAAVWVPSNLFTMLLPVWGGIEAAGLYRAHANLLMPFLLALTALSKLLLPTLVRARGGHGFMNLVRIIGAGLTCAAIGYLLLLLLLGKRLMHTLYGSAFETTPTTLLLLGALAVVSAIAVTPRAALRSLEQPKSVFIAYGIAAAASLTLGVVLARAHLVDGAIAGQVVAAICAVLVLIGLLRRATAPYGGVTAGQRTPGQDIGTHSRIQRPPVKSGEQNSA